MAHVSDDDEDYTEESYYEEEVLDDSEYFQMSAADDEQVARFRKMAKMGIPEGAVRIKMAAEGCSEQVMDAVFSASPTLSPSGRGKTSPKAASPASPPRAPHPLFANGDAKSALAAAAGNMKAKQTNSPSSRPIPAFNSAPASPSIDNNNRSALNDQIIAMALKKAGGGPPRTSTIQQSAPPPTKASSNPLADQVAMLAANRAKRLAGEPVDTEPNTSWTAPAPRTSAPPPQSTELKGRVTRQAETASAVPAPAEAPAAIQPTAASVSSTTKGPTAKSVASTGATQKTGWFSGNSAEAAAPAPSSAAVSDPTPSQPTLTTLPAAVNEKDAPATHDFQQVKLKPPSDTPRANSVPSPARKTTTPTSPNETVVTQVVTLDGGVTRTTTTTTTTTRVKRVTKSDEPAYETTEYKCGCSVM